MRLRAAGPSEAEAMADRAQAAFGADGDRGQLVERVRRRLEQGRGWCLEADGTVVAQAFLWAADHWFGGRRVPCQHVGAVAVPPEHRGWGAGRTLMEQAVAMGAAEGLGLSMLFPATTALYRRLGYEHAGHYTSFELDARRAVGGTPPLRAVDPTDEATWAAIRACADEAGRMRSGPEVRDDVLWERLRGARFAYVLDGHHASPGDRVAAYALVDHSRDPGDWQYVLDLVDWAAVTADGLRALVGFVGSHGTLGKAVRFNDGLPSVWAQLVEEQDVEVRDSFMWMARGLDLPAAVAARGFPEALAVSVSFEVADPLLPAACGPWRLDVDGGRGALSACDGADVRLDVRAVGPLFTGFRSPEELALAGLVQGPARGLAALGAAFAGPAPYLLDFF